MYAAATGLRPRLPPRPAASSPGGPPAARTPEKRSPTSHLFWQKQQEWQRSCASCWREAVSSRVWEQFSTPGAALEPVSGVINRLQSCSPATARALRRGGCQSRRGRQSPPFSAGGLPDSGEECWRPAAGTCSLGRATARDQGRSGSRSRNHGDGGGADGGGQLPAAGWEWFFPASPPAPSHRRADLKRQPAVSPSVPTESDTAQQNISLKKAEGGLADFILLLQETPVH